MDQENGYREVRRLITVYCGYNSRLTVYCLHVADVIFERNRVQPIRGNSFPIPLLNYDAFLPFFFHSKIVLVPRWEEDLPRES